MHTNLVMVEAWAWVRRTNCYSTNIRHCCNISYVARRWRPPDAHSHSGRRDARSPTTVGLEDLLVVQQWYVQLLHPPRHLRLPPQLPR